MAKTDRSAESYKRQLEYRRNTVKQIKLEMNKNTEADLIEWLEAKKNQQGKAGGIAGYIKALIRADIEKQGK